MKLFHTIVLFLLLPAIATAQYGKAIVEHLGIYELEDRRWDHDYFIAEILGEMLDTAVSVTANDTLAVIVNTINDGFTGHEVRFAIDSTLEIRSATYVSWTDNIILDTEDKTHVEQVVLSLDKSPFEHSHIQGRYSIVLREEFTAAEYLAEQGIRDTTTYSTFHGKFKVYTEEEKKLSKEEVLRRNEIALGHCDSTGLYRYTYPGPQYRFGNDSLQSMLKELVYQYPLDGQPKDRFYIGTMTVEADGTVDPQSIVVEPFLESSQFETALKSHTPLHRNWIPAVVNGRPVKALVDIGVGEER